MSANTFQQNPSFLIGAYTGEQGEATGIGILTTADDGHTVSGVAARFDSPSFLTQHPTLPVVYAVGEDIERVAAFRLVASGSNQPPTLEPLGESWAAGEAVCHASVSPDGAILIATCWGDGQVVAYALDTEGAIVGRTVAQPAVDPYSATAELPTPPGIPRISRAHCSLFLPDGRILTSDLGYDTVRIWHRDGAALVLDQELALGQNTGPRHLALHPSGSVLVVTEYSIEVVIVAADESGRYSIVHRTPATPSGAEPDDAAAEISLDGTARFAYVTVRSSDRVGVLAVDPSGRSAVAVHEFACGGSWPRHHLLHDGALLVANQLSSSIAVFPLDPHSGLPAADPAVIATPSPTCILRVRATPA